MSVCEGGVFVGACFYGELKRSCTAPTQSGVSYGGM